jgi:hypothetical protein
VGIRRIARELGCSHMTVRHCVALGGWLPFGWRGLFGIGLLPAFLAFVIFAWVPESPRGC